MTDKAPAKTRQKRTPTAKPVPTKATPQGAQHDPTLSIAVGLVDLRQWVTLSPEAKANRMSTAIGDAKLMMELYEKTTHGH